MRPGAAFVVSVARGCGLSALLILALPAIAGPNAIWFSMPITELLVALYAGREIARRTRALP